MKILFIGDIIGRPGRNTVKKLLPEILAEHQPDLVLANAENLTHGSGFTVKHVEEMRGLGINAFTSGNHVWDRDDGSGALNDKSFPVIRPANYVDDRLPGRGYDVFECKDGREVLVINLLGELFINAEANSPFFAADRILEKYKGYDLAGIFVDIHAEATSEKYALAHYLDGRVGAVVGTHTHVATQDARILSGGTAYISDVGMVGPYDGVIGVAKGPVLKRFLGEEKLPFSPQIDGEMIFNGVVVELDDHGGKALNIIHVSKFL